MKTRNYFLVTFHSPGSFFNENSTKEFKKLDIKAFLKHALNNVKERYGATPFAFSYQEMQAPVAKNIEGFKVNPKTIGKASGMFYINGEVIFHENLNGKDEQILRSNLQYNCDGVGVVTQNSYKHHAMFFAEDLIVNDKGETIRKGTDKDLVEYRKKVRANRDY